MIRLTAQGPNGPQTVYHYDTKNNSILENGIPLTPEQPACQGHCGNNGVTVRLALGKKCNFACSYCIQAVCKKDEPDTGLPPEEFARIVRRFFGDAPVNVFQFWGGEPLVYFEKIKAVHACLKKQGYKDTNFAYVTNGSLLHGERLRWTLENKINVSLSHDGPGQHVRGKEIFDDHRIVDAVRAIHGSGYQAAYFLPVMHRANASHREYVDYIREKTGIGDFLIGTARLPTVYDDTTMLYTVPEDELPEYSRRLYHSLASGYLPMWSIGNMQIDQFIKGLGTPVQSGVRCHAAGSNTAVIDLRGNLLSCQSYSADHIDGDSGEPALLGNIAGKVFSSYNPRPQGKRLHERQKNLCAKCPVYAICQGGCPYSPKKYDRYNCMASFYEYLPIFGVALYRMTGKLLKHIDFDINKHLELP